jgi:Chemotaxis response regulator containing a CheY-like receiver domain and a methylesterase domain
MSTARRTRILIVDDSAVMRSLLRAVVGMDAQLEVAGTAAEGAAALDCISVVRPDLILLDVEMPVMDGLATLRVLRARWSGIPVIMCSSLTQRGAKVTIEALAGGAADYVAKPPGQSDREGAIRKLAAELLPRIRALTSKNASRSASTLTGESTSRLQHPLPQIRATNELASPTAFALQPITAAPSVVVIGVSTGGPAALDAVLPDLPGDFPLPILTVQHMPELFTGILAERLNGRCKLRVREAVQGDPVSAGNIYIARGNWHMEAVTSSLPDVPVSLRLHQGPAENHCRPAVDVLFRSAASVYGAGVLAVVLTGMGSDGAKGCREIRESGGTVLAQDEATSTVWGMPGAVVNAGLAHRILPLQMIATEILGIARPAANQPVPPAHARFRQAVL